MMQERVNLDEIRAKVKEELAELDETESAIGRRRRELLELLAPVERITKPKPAPVSNFSNWTIPAAAKQLILEAGGPLTTRQILDGMWARGWRTPSQRPITVVHSGLAESPYIERIGKKWDVSKRGLETEI